MKNYIIKKYLNEELSIYHLLSEICGLCLTSLSLRIAFLYLSPVSFNSVFHWSEAILKKTPILSM